MSEPQTTPAGGTAAGTATRRSTGTASRRRSSNQPGTGDAPALAPQRDDKFQAVRRVWPD
jgi:hypothetical protein